LLIVLTIFNLYKDSRNIRGGYLFLIVLSFFVYSLVIAVNHVSISPKAMLYAIQWNLFFFWLCVFYSIQNNSFAIERLFNGITYGAYIGALYIFLCGAFEILIFGALTDSGRMAQNKVLPGQYQLYVYVPTMLSYSTLFTNWLIRSGKVNHRKWFFYSLNFITFVAIIFTGSREGILVYMLGMLLFVISTKKSMLLFATLSAPVFLLLIYLNLSAILSGIGSEDIRLLSKFASLAEGGAKFGARDVMIADYMVIINSAPFVGTGMLPPNISMPQLGILAPSAHNFYVDVFAWSGVLGGGVILLFSGAIIIKSLKIIIFTDYRYLENHILVGGGILSLIFLLLSSNINVPYRQPLTAPIFAILVSLFYCKLNFNESS